MFCPKCGTADQKENTYCRNCGDFLPDLTKKNNLAFGGNTPEEQIKVSQKLNLLSAIVSFAVAILLYWAHWGKPNVSSTVYMAATFLLTIGLWQISNYVIGLKLKRHFNKRKEGSDNENKSAEKQFQSVQTNELLPEAELSKVVPTSITENTTRHLSKKINRKSS